MRALAAEFVGTAALVFFGCGAIGNSLGAPSTALAFGLVIAVMIYGLGHISGAHLNPVVSVAFAVGRHFPWSRVATYSVAQITGAIAGALILRLSLGADVSLGVTHPASSAGQAFVWEVVLAFVLVLVITAVATDARAVGQVAAIAIGGTVALCALVGGPVSGASMNPARSLGPALVSGDIVDLALYIVARVPGHTDRGSVLQMDQASSLIEPTVARDRRLIAS